MPSTVFLAEKVRALKPAIQLFDSSTIHSGTLDPTVTAINAVKGDVYISTTTGRIYSKLDDGENTNWSVILTSDTFTDGSIPFADADGNLVEDNTNLKFNDITNTLFVPNIDSPSGTLNIGSVGGTVNIYGSLTAISTTNTEVTDKLITLNKGGVVGSANGSGLEIEENSVITGYNKVSNDRNSFELKAPNTAGIATITPGAGGITLNQSSHDSVTLGAVGSSPNANAASISGQILTLQPADSTNPGIVSTGSQTLAGAKSFTENLTVSKSQAGVATTILINNAHATGQSTLNVNSGAGGQGLTLNSDSGIQSLIVSTSGNTNGLIISQLGANPLKFRTNGSDRLTIAGTGEVVANSSLTINSSGNSLIISAGNTTDATYVKFSSNNGAVNHLFGIDNATGTTFGYGSAYSLNLGTSGAQDLLLFTNNIVRLTISSAGAATFTGSISASNFSGSSSGTNTGDLTIGTANGLSLVGQALSLGLSSGATTGALSSADWTTFNNKQPAGNYITALTGEVTATGPGSVAATVVSVGGSSAADINTATQATNTATSNNTANTLVKRDASGDFSAGTITADLTGIASGNLLKILGDIDPGSFTANQGQTNQNVTGLAFSAVETRSFDAIVSVTVDATTPLFESFNLHGVQRDGSWVLSYTSVGDESGFDFSITNTGQIQYTSTTYAGFTTAIIKFRATVLPVSGNFTTVAGGSPVYFVERFTLTGLDVSNKYILLSNAPTSTEFVIAFLVNDVVPNYGTDYTMTADDGGKRLSWNGLAFDGYVVAGDKLIVMYN